MFTLRRAGTAVLVEEALKNFDAGRISVQDLCRTEDFILAKVPDGWEDRPWTGALLLSRLRAIEASDNPRVELTTLIRLLETPVASMGEHVKHPRLRRLFRRYAGTLPSRPTTLVLGLFMVGC